LRGIMVWVADSPKASRSHSSLRRSTSRAGTGMMASHSKHPAPDEGVVHSGRSRREWPTHRSSTPVLLHACNGTQFAKGVRLPIPRRAFSTFRSRQP
jgi:hypothetical protein